MTRNVLLILLAGTIHLKASHWRLDALGMIESGDNDAAIGAAGEISRYQIQPWIWRRYSDSQDYRNRQVAAKVAQQHLQSLERIFTQCARRDLSDFDLYVLWNAGPTYYARAGWTPGRVHAVIRDRARRYSNLCERLQAKVPSRTAKPIVPFQPTPPQTGPPQPASPPASPFHLDALGPKGSAPPESLLVSRNSVFAIAGSR